MDSDPDSQPSSKPNPKICLDQIRKYIKLKGTKKFLRMKFLRSII